MANGLLQYLLRFSRHARVVAFSPAAATPDRVEVRRILAPPASWSRFKVKLLWESDPESRNWTKLQTARRNMASGRNCPAEYSSGQSYVQIEGTGHPAHEFKKRRDDLGCLDKLVLRRNPQDDIRQSGGDDGAFYRSYAES